MQTPTVGRKVWLWNAGGYFVRDAAQPMDATVIFVHRPDLVDLDCVDHAGQRFHATSVRLHDPSEKGGPVLSSIHATWMPYQKAQADKAAAEQAAKKEPAK